MIKIEAVSQRFHGAQGAIEAVRDVNLEIRKGEIFGIIGRSGAGKSTLVRAINLLNRPSAGRIVVDGKDLTALPAAALRDARREIGMIFQHFNLLSSRTVAANIALPLELAGTPKAEIDKRVEALLELVGLQAQRDRYPAQISGGQKQRVGIARALANNPKVLLSDEATSALDPETTRSILALLQKINRELGLTIVLITHQMEVIKDVCDRMAVMDAGAIIEQGNVIDIFRRPAHAVTRALIGDVIAQALPPSVLKRLRERLLKNDAVAVTSTGSGSGADSRIAADPDACTDHLFRLAFTGAAVDQPLLSEVVRKFDLDFNILHGQIEEIQGQAFGSLAILANGSAANIAAAMQYLQEQNVVIEELNHVI
jgi:D-methionine transport system ATP-binding protein